MASSNETIEKSVLHDWAEAETRALDLVASWESLCITYKTLEFTDPLSDSTKMEEFKWIIKEMNKHLTRARKQLLTCRNIDSTREVLLNMFTTGPTSITSRQDLAYHKLKQQWINQMLMQLQAMKEQATEEEIEDGEPDF